MTSACFSRGHTGFSRNATLVATVNPPALAGGVFKDASSECVKVTNSNKLTEANTARILDTFIKREDVEHFAKVVTNADIEAQDYNLSVSTYVEQEDKREVVDIRELNKQIEEIVAREAVLRAEIDKIIAEIEG